MTGPPLSPGQRATLQAAQDGIWRLVVEQVSLHVEHTLTCAEPDCPGAILPWLMENATTREDAIILATVVLERMAALMTDRTVMAPEGTP